MREIRFRRGLCLAALLLPTPLWAQAVGPIEPAGRWTAKRAGVAATPPMGWSSWNAFRTEIDEEKLLGSAAALVRTGLAKRGYVYVNIDDGWWLQRRAKDGRLIVRTQIFPSAAARKGGETSLRPLVDRLHGMGLKAGIYTDLGRNACSQAYDLTSPNLPIGTTAEREVGLLGHVDKDIKLFFDEWKFDYLKVDACGIADYAADRPYVAQQNYRPMPPVIFRGEPARTDAKQVRALYQDVASAMRRHAPQGAFLSICAWGQADVRAWAKDVGNAWRTGEDITPSWTSMLQAFDTAAGRALYAHPGAWNDPDMLFIGTGDFDKDHLVEARSHFSLWAIINAPLIIGYDLRKAPQSLIDIWGNATAVAINQDAAGNQGTIAFRSNDLTIIVKTLSDGRKATAVLNRTARPVKANLTAAHMKLAGDAPVKLADVWNAANSLSFTGETELALAPHETRLFIVDGKRQLADGDFLSEMPGSINVAIDGVRQAELDPTIHRGISPWSGTRSEGERPIYTGWGGAQTDGAPYGTALTVGGRVFGTGIGILSGSRMEVKSDGRYTRFSAEVGIDDGSRNRDTPVRFAVYGDGRLLVQTDPLRFGGAPVPITADVSGVKVVELIARTADEAAVPVSSTWAMAALTGRK